MILITGAGGMLGSYLVEEFKDLNIKTLGLRRDNNFIVDLRNSVPDFGNLSFDTVIHAAGTEDNQKGYELNLEGTKNLLRGLETHAPENFVYISSYKVYSHDAGENITEDANTWATNDAGKSKALAEEYVRNWCVEKGVTLTIVRPARMFGNGVKGETLTLFNDALNGKYIHIRGNDARLSLVCALDVAKGIRNLYDTGGIYNVSDNQNVKLIDLVESMTANVGGKKRMTHLPAAWAEWLWRLGRWIPSIQRNLNPDTVAERMKTLTLDGSKFEKASGIKYHDTLKVIERKHPTYPYTEK